MYIAVSNETIAKTVALVTGAGCLGNTKKQIIHSIAEENGDSHKKIIGLGVRTYHIYTWYEFQHKPRRFQNKILLHIIYTR